jgi:hypothetical protein
VVDSTRPEASLTGVSGCTRLPHEGEWAWSFGSAQRRKRWLGGGTHWRTEAVAESGRQSGQCGAKVEEVKRGNPRPSVRLL